MKTWQGLSLAKRKTKTIIRPRRHEQETQRIAIVGIADQKLKILTKTVGAMLFAFGLAKLNPFYLEK